MGAVDMEQSLASTTSNVTGEDGQREGLDDHDEQTLALEIEPIFDLNDLFADGNVEDEGAWMAAAIKWHQFLNSLKQSIIKTMVLMDWTWTRSLLYKFNSLQWFAMNIVLIDVF